MDQVFADGFMFKLHNIAAKLLVFMKTLYRLKHWMIPPTGVIIAVLSTTIALGWLAVPGHTAPAEPTVLALSSTAQCAIYSVSILSVKAALQSIPQGLAVYEPPDNGGPGRTGGSGTRWRIKSV